MTQWDAVNLPLDKLYGVQLGYEDNAKKHSLTAAAL